MELKRLGLGCMRFPLLDAEDPTSVDLEQVKQMVDLFLEKGFTYFDTAYMYHNHTSEKVMKEALVKRYPRDRYLLATKLPSMSLKDEGDQERIFEEQLEKCGVEYFDYYLLHCLDQDNYEKVQRFDSFRFVQKKKAEGKVKKMGFSFHDTAELLDEILTAHPETEFVQLQINYIDWEDEEVQSRKCYEVCKKHGKPVIIMEPVKGGMLVSVPEEAERVFKEAVPEASVASWAIRYAASLDNVMMVLSGMSNLEQLVDNISVMDDFKALTEEERSIVEKVVKILNDSIAVPCTACRYCVEGCPQNIAIPDYFALYNKFALYGENSRARIKYEDYRGKNGLASECIACGQCEGHCPQHLPIIENLKKVAETFES